MLEKVIYLSIILIFVAGLISLCLLAKRLDTLFKIGMIYNPEKEVRTNPYRRFIYFIREKADKYSDHFVFSFLIIFIMSVIIYNWGEITIAFDFSKFWEALSFYANLYIYILFGLFMLFLWFGCLFMRIHFLNRRDLRKVKTILSSAGMIPEYSRSTMKKDMLSDIVTIIVYIAFILVCSIFFELSGKFKSNPYSIFLPIIWAIAVSIVPLFFGRGKDWIHMGMRELIKSDEYEYVDYEKLRDELVELNEKHLIKDRIKKIYKCKKLIYKVILVISSCLGKLFKGILIILSVIAILWALGRVSLS
jgi:hypothetical protein